MVIDIATFPIKTQFVFFSFGFCIFRARFFFYLLVSFFFIKLSFFFGFGARKCWYSLERSTEAKNNYWHMVERSFRGQSGHFRGKTRGSCDNGEWGKCRLFVTTGWSFKLVLFVFEICAIFMFDCVASECVFSCGSSFLKFYFYLDVANNILIECLEKEGHHY